MIFQTDETPLIAETEQRTSPTMPAADHPAAGYTVIRPPRGLFHVDVAELWHYRELLYFFAWRDIKVRYQQTLLGAAWALLQPVLTMVIFSVFFGRLARMPSDGVPYPLFVYTALVPWSLFAYALTNSSNSVVDGADMIRKVYFPRLIMPVSSIVAGLLDFFIAFAFLLVLLLAYGITPTWPILALPPLILLVIFCSLGVGFWLAALNVRYRDVRHTVPFLTQLWLFATPVAYPASLLPEPWHSLYGLNPMVGVVDGFRWALLGRADHPGALLAISTGAVLLIFLTGLLYFRQMEASFADVI